MAQQLTTILTALDQFYALWGDFISARRLQEYVTLSARGPRHRLVQCHVQPHSSSTGTYDLPVVRFDDGQEVAILHYPPHQRPIPLVATANATYIAALTTHLIRLTALQDR